MDHSLPTAEATSGRRRSTDNMAQPRHPGPRLARDLVWAGLPTVDVDRARLSSSHVVTLERSDPNHAVFDMMRTNALQSLRQNNWTSIAITSPTRCCGTTTLTLNLAFSLAHQRDCRTVLIDLNLRTPGIANMLDVAAPISIDNFLSGNGQLNEAFVRFGDNLAIATLDQNVNFSAELMQHLEVARALEEICDQLDPDVILYDMPPLLGCDDVTAFLPNVDCVLLVAAAEKSTFEEIKFCERHLSARANLLGIVLNKCRHGPGT